MARSASRGSHRAVIRVFMARDISARAARRQWRNQGRDRATIGGNRWRRNPQFSARAGDAAALPVIEPALRWPALTLVETASSCHGCGTCRSLDPTARACARAFGHCATRRHRPGRRPTCCGCWPTARSIPVSGAATSSTPMPILHPLQDVPDRMPERSRRLELDARGQGGATSINTVCPPATGSSRESSSGRDSGADFRS